MNSIAAVFVFVALVATCTALPGGAPAGACADLVPQHGVAAMPNPSPYELDVSDFISEYGMMAGQLTYLPGAYYTITLRGMNVTAPANLTANITANAIMTTFRGFLIQAQDMDGMRVGEFMIPAETQNVARLSSCEIANTAAVTHVNPGRLDLQSVTFKWRAPTMVTTGPIEFAYTTVQNFTTFWVAETSASIGEVPLMCPGGAASVTSLGLWALLGTAVLTALKVTV